MGACQSLETRSYVDEQNALAEQIMQEAKQEQMTHSKFLLLGTRGSGKSTILRQMRVNSNTAPFTPKEVEAFRQIIFSNMIDCMMLIREIMEDEAFDLDCPEDITQLFDEVQLAGNVSEGDPYPSRYFYVLQRLWNDSEVQKALRIGYQFALLDNMRYFFSNLPRLFNASYTPTKQDILHSRLTTSGVTETQLSFRTAKMSIIDVGGQQSERRRWIHCFQDVTAVLFVVSLSGYDQVLAEDRQVNEMREAMQVWSSICLSPWFTGTSFVLLLNKVDIFVQKCAHSSIRRAFPDFDGDEWSYAEGMIYFKRRFTHLHTRRIQKNTIGAPNRPNVPRDTGGLYTQFTTAMNDDLIHTFMVVLADIILRGNISSILLI